MKKTAFIIATILSLLLTSVVAQGITASRVFDESGGVEYSTTETEAYNLAKAEAERQAAIRAEQERIAAQQAEEERLAAEEAARLRCELHHR